MGNTIKVYVDLNEAIEHHYAPRTDCAVTRAFKRAGYPHLTDTGMGIINSQTNKYITPKDIEGYVKLQRGMTNLNKRIQQKDLITRSVRATLKLNV